MQVVVTGACSSLGQALLREIVRAQSLVRVDGRRMPVARILAADATQPSDLFLDERIEYVRGDLAQPRFLSRMMGAITDSIFHLVPPLASGGGSGGEPGDESGGRLAAATVLSAHAALEHELELSFDVTRMLVEACAFQHRPPRLVYVPEFPGAGAGNALSGILAAEAGRHGIVQACAVPLVNLGPERFEQFARMLVAAHDAAPALGAAPPAQAGG